MMGVEKKMSCIGRKKKNCIWYGTKKDVCGKGEKISLIKFSQTSG